MYVNNVNLTGKVLSDFDLSRLQIGQRLQVEVISKGQNQEGLISVGGKLIKAKLEVQVEPGERFWAAVKEADKNGIVLSREFLNNARLSNLSTEQLIILVSRGFAIDAEISAYLSEFTANDKSYILALLESENPLLRNLAAKLLANIPNWSTLKGTDISDLIKYYENLGLEYERALYENYKNGQNDQKQDNLSLKALLLNILYNNDALQEKRDKNILTKLLEQITGQQLWLQSGAGKNAYCLMQIPIQDNGEIHYCKIAIESSRKGRKVDKEHCHLALQVDTPNAGLIGADLLIYENSIDISLLSDNTDVINPLIQEIYPDAEKGFELVGYRIQKLAVKSFEEYPNFSRFLTGSNLTGVDIKG